MKIKRREAAVARLRSRPTQPTFFASAAGFRAWLERWGASTPELIVGYYKVASGVPNITWPESVEEALCFGWIDGVRKRIDDNTYQIRFTPRRAGSIWSTINVKIVARLQGQGRMHEAGLTAYARRSERKTNVYAYEQAGTLTLSAAQRRAFRSNKVAWAYWRAAPPSYTKVLTYWVVSAKQEATRLRRLAQLIDACGRGKRLLK